MRRVNAKGADLRRGTVRRVNDACRRARDAGLPYRGARGSGRPTRASRRQGSPGLTGPADSPLLQNDGRGAQLAKRARLPEAMLYLVCALPASADLFGVATGPRVLTPRMSARDTQLARRSTPRPSVRAILSMLRPLAHPGNNSRACVETC